VEVKMDKIIGLWKILEEWIDEKVDILTLPRHQKLDQEYVE